MFTKQHYIKVADQIKDAVTSNPKLAKPLGKFAVSLCGMFAQDNVKFNRARFLAHAGIKDPG